MNFSTSISRLPALIGLLVFTSPAVALAHGGNYAGPTTAPPHPPAPSPGSYSGPTDSGGVRGPGPRTQGPATPSGPTPGGASATPGGGTRGGGGVTTGFYDVSADFSRWELWWDLNKHSLLRLRSSLFAEGPSTGAAAELGAVDRLRPSDAELRANVLPKLLFVLQHERNPDLVTGAIVALSKIGLDASLSSEFAHFLSDSNQEIAETATLGLGLLRDDRALPALLSLARDDAQGRSFAAKPAVPARTRIFAIYALALFGSQTPESPARERIVAALRGISSDSVEIQIARVLALGIVKDPQRAAAEDLRRILMDREADARVRAMVPISLARLLVEREAASSAHPLLAPLRETMLRMAENAGEPEWLRVSCVQALPHFAQGADAAFAAAARQALARVLFEARTGGEKQLAAIALGRLGGIESEEALAKALAKSGTIRPWAALGLGLLGRENPDRVAPIAAKLRAALENEKNPSTASALALALGLLRDGESASLLLARLSATSNDDLQGYLALSLGMIGAREALPQISKVAFEAVRRPELQQQAVIALGLLGDKTVALELVRKLGEARTLAAQSSLACAIGWIGDRRSLESLLPLLEGVRLAPLGRAFVAAAIGMIGDPDEVHWSSRLSSDLNYLAAPPSLIDPSGLAGLLNIL